MAHVGIVCLRERMAFRAAASSNPGSGEGRAPLALGSEQGWDMDAPLWIATSYGMLEVDPMNSCFTIVDVPSMEVFRLDGAWISLV